MHTYMGNFDRVFGIIKPAVFRKTARLFGYRTTNSCVCVFYTLLAVRYIFKFLVFPSEFNIFLTVFEFILPKYYRKNREYFNNVRSVNRRENSFLPVTLHSLDIVLQKWSFYFIRNVLDNRAYSLCTPYTNG